MESTNDVTFDDILKLAGSHGKWQWMTFFLTSVSGFFVALHNIGAVFLAATPEYYCHLPQVEQALASRNITWSSEHIGMTFSPSIKTGLDRCSYYHANVDDLDDEDLTNTTHLKSIINRFNVSQCDSWVYSQEQYISTVITEWNLVCSKKALGSTVQSSFMAGVLLGCIIFGWVSDRYGRKRSVLIAVVMFVGSAIIASFSTHYIMFLIFRFVCAVGDAGVFSVTFVIIMEISGKTSRAFLGLQFMSPFALGFMILPLIAYFIRDWFVLQLAISIPCVLLLSYFWLLFESPRWLITQGRLKDAMVILKNGARINGRVLPPDDELFSMLTSAQSKDKKQAAGEQKSGNFFDLVRTPVIRKRSLVTGLVWFVAGMVYYGLSFSAPAIGVSVYIYVALAAFVEFPAFLFVYFCIQRFGRKKVYVVTMLISGLCCLLILIIPTEITWALATVALLGKFFSTSTFGLCFLYTVELFPTPVRNLAVGTGAMLSRFGAVVAPFVIDILGQYHSMIPMVIFGTLCLISGLLSVLLPETIGCNLPETVDEVENKNTNLRQAEELTTFKPKKDNLNV